MKKLKAILKEKIGIKVIEDKLAALQECNIGMINENHEIRQRLLELESQNLMYQQNMKCLKNEITAFKDG